MLNSAHVNDDLKGILEKINNKLEQINVKLEKMLSSKAGSQRVANEEGEGHTALDVMTLLSLPDHLRKTAIILSRLGRASAKQISLESKRARAVESNYLNQLVVMNYVKKMRVGRTVYFYIE